LRNIIETVKENYQELQSLRAYARENGIVHVDAFLKGFLKMKKYKTQVNDMVKDLLDNSADNQAVTHLAILLGLVNQISSEPTQNYCIEAIAQLEEIGMRMVKDTGTVSEQFELMVMMSRFKGQPVEPEPESEE